MKMWTRVSLVSSACALILLPGAHAQQQVEPRDPDAPIIDMLEKKTKKVRQAEERAASSAPGCEIGVHPHLVPPGQQVRISWTMRNATAATLDRKSVAVSDEKSDEVDHPTRTRTYSMTVSGPNGTASCRTSVAVPERTEPSQWPPAPFAGLPADYLARARDSLAAGIKSARLESDQRWVIYATASLMFEQDMPAVNDYFATHWRFPAHPDLGFGLFSMDSVRLYGLFNGRSGTFPGRLSDGAQKRMEEEFFEVVSQSRVSDYDVISNPARVWQQRGSENHTLAAWSSSFLTSQYLKNSPDFAKRTYEDGRTPAQHYEAWREFISMLLEERAKRGMFIEVGSPSYEDESRQAIQNIRDFAEDPVIAKKAEMVLDVAYALIAQDSLQNGVRGGARSRVYTFMDQFWGGATDRPYNVLFAPPGYAVLTAPVQATSSYFPPPAILGLGRDAAGRGSYETIQRVPGVGEAGKDAMVERDRSVYRYVFATPGYVLGSFVLDPKASYIAPSAQNRWQGIVFEGDTGARIAPQVTRIRGRMLDTEQRVPNGFASLQDRNVMITQRAPGRDKAQSRTDVYFSSALDAVDEEDGWIFAREKDSFAAVRVVSPAPKAYEWLDARMKNRNENKRLNFIALANPDSPIIFVAGLAADYGGDFARFKAAVKVQPIRQGNDALSFATLTFYGPQKIGSRNGTPVDITPRRVYDSPFMRSEFGSGVIHIRKGDDTVTLDFSNRDQPVKTVGGQAAGDFPDGVGKARPIVFEAR